MFCLRCGEAAGEIYRGRKKKQPDMELVYIHCIGISKCHIGTAQNSYYRVSLLMERPTVSNSKLTAHSFLTPLYIRRKLRRRWTRLKQKAPHVPLSLSAQQLYTRDVASKSVSQSAPTLCLTSDTAEKSIPPLTGHSSLTGQRGVPEAKYQRRHCGTVRIRQG